MIRFFRNIMLILLISILIGGYCSAQSIEDQLLYNDQMVYNQFTTFYPPDNRYNGYLNEIASNLNRSIVDVFGEDKNVTFYVCTSQLGFNASAFYRFIVFDSLLLDSLRYLAMGVAYYGNINNEYVDRLACQVAATSMNHQRGISRVNYSNLQNPFNLPAVGELSPAQRQRAERLFKSMLASWMAHEGSHCMLDHVKVRLEKMSEMQNNSYQGDQQQFNSAMNQYAHAQLNQSMEREADMMGTRWLLASGYNAEGFVTWLKFAEKLEHYMGTQNAYIRTHPSSRERISNILNTAKIRKNGRRR